MKSSKRGRLLRMGFPPDGSLMLCKVVSRHESKDVLLEAFKVGIVERLDGGVLDGAVHAFGLAIGRGMAW